MRKSLSIINNIVLMVSLLLMAGCFHPPKQKDGLPSFNILLADSLTIVNTIKIAKDKPVALIFFSPDCEHCQKETTSILHHIDSLKNVQFIFVTIDPIERLSAFNGYYKLFKYSNIITGQDYSYFFPGHFKNVSPPYTLLYDKYQRIRAVFAGESEATELIHCIGTF